MRRALSVGLLAALAIALWWGLASDRDTGVVSVVAKLADDAEPEDASRVPEPASVGRPGDRSLVATASDVLDDTVPANDTPHSEPAAQGTCVVHGVVTDPEGRRIEARLLFTERSGKESRVGARGGSFSLPGLEPGLFWVQVSSELYETWEEQVAVPTGRSRHDFVLRPRPRLTIHVSTPEGTPLREALGDDASDLARRLKAVATAEEPERWLEGVSGSVNDSYQLGMFYDVGEHPDLPDHAWGALVLRRAPPVHVSLVCGQEVLGTQLVEPGIDEVAFRLGDLTATTSDATIRMRLVDAETGAPATDVQVMLSNTHFGGGWRGIADDGEVTIQDVVPGHHVLRILGRYVWKRIEVVAEPGETVDLGIVRLESAARVRGTVIDPAGNPVPAELVIDSIDGTGNDGLAGFGFSTAADGRFEIGGFAPGVYALRARAEAEAPWCSPFQTLDLRAGSVDDLILHAAHPSFVVLVATPASVGRLYWILDDEGREVAARQLHRAGPHRVPLPPGSYLLRTAEGDGFHEVAFELGAGDVRLTVPER